MSSIDQSGDRVVPVVLLTGGCCRPGLEVLERRTAELVRQAIAESGAPAELRVISLSAAARGGLPPEVVEKLTPDYLGGRIPLPAVLVGEEVVSAGVPDLDALRGALVRLVGTHDIEEIQHA